MKKIIICLATAIAFVFTACEEVEHAEGMKVTYYPVWDLEGGQLYAFQVGSEFVDPGYSATLDGEDVTADVEVIGEVDGETSGMYQLTYSYTNPDGFTNTISRTVAVYDVANAGTADISGDYATSYCYRHKANGTTDNYQDNYGFNVPMTITKGPAAGLFYVKCLLGGLYNGGAAAYGAAYEYKALILLNADNTINILNGADIDPWGDPIYDTENATYAGLSKYDPVTGDVNIYWDWYGSTTVYHTYYTNN